MKFFIKSKINSFILANVLRDLKSIYKKIIRNTSPNYYTMSVEESKDNIKRPLEKEEDEEWVKRIQLDPVPEIVSNDVTAPSRRKLRKFVLLLSYCGQGYLGMQRNPGYRTIEDDLLVAMLQADLIKEEGVTCPQIYRFQRAARTDKGVSAVRQIVSVKLPDDVDIPAAINGHLPEQIRVMKAVRVTQKFDAKTQCDSRSYSYFCPTFAFAPREETYENYRVSGELLEEIRNIFKKYKGTHNYHNFTARVKFQDRNAMRYIMDFTCSDPFIRNGIEWTLIKVKGQSFMLHQIRKMVGLAISIRKGYVSMDIFNHIWRQARQDVPIAPSLGLVLEEPHYDYYNRKYNDGYHEQLLWASEEEKIQAFREKFIDSIVVETEVKEKSMLNWLETLQYHTFDIRVDGPPGEKCSNNQGHNENSQHDLVEGEEDDNDRENSVHNKVRDNGCTESDSSNLDCTELTKKKTISE